jgi:hypothetical protein
METTDPQIWVLGLKESNADKTITWDQPFPNFNEPDVLIIDLNSLTDKVLERLDKSNLREARDQIFNKFVNGGTIIFFTASYHLFVPKDDEHTKAQKRVPNVKVKLVNLPIHLNPIYSNYYLSPIEFKTPNVAAGKRIKCQQDNEFFSSYLSKLSSFSYYLHNFKISQSFAEIEPTNDMMSTIIKSLEGQPDNVSRQDDILELMRMNLATDNSDNAISVECWLKVDGYWDSGKVIYLPPPTNRISIRDAIDFILDKYGKSITSQLPPDWVNNVPLATLSDLNTSLSGLISKKEAIDVEINETQAKVKAIQKYRRLLFELQPR